MSAVAKLPGQFGLPLDTAEVDVALLDDLLHRVVGADLAFEDLAA